MNTSMRKFSNRVVQQGFSLVELMVAMVVGLMVVGALMAGYYAIFVNNRHTQAMSQVTEDAAVALGMLRGQVSLAGYSRPLGASGTKFEKAYNGALLAGCDGDFSALGVDIGELDCAAVKADSTEPDSLAVAFEADTSNSVSSGGVPLDCLGNALTVVGAGAKAYYLSYSRFYLDDSAVSGHKSLYCRGPGNDAGQALVENIEDLQIQYGVASDISKSTAVAYYASAAQLAGGVADNIASKLTGVVSVRVCVVVASNAEVMDAKTDYIDCSRNKVTPDDKRMYRAFTSTMLLQNRRGAV